VIVSGAGRQDRLGMPVFPASFLSYSDSWQSSSFVPFMPLEIPHPLSSRFSAFSVC